MRSPYRISSNSHEKDKRFQIQISMVFYIASVTSKDLKRPQKNYYKKRSKLGGGDAIDNASHGSVLIEQAFADSMIV